MFRKFVLCLLCFSIIFPNCMARRKHNVIKGIINDIKDFMNTAWSKFTDIGKEGIVPDLLSHMTLSLNITFGKGNVRGKVIGIDNIVDILKGIINKFSLVPDYRKLTYQSYDQGMTTLLCNGCQVFVGISIFLLREVVVDHQTMKEAYIIICLLFKNREFCEGLISLHTPILFYIVQNTIVTESEFCAIIFQWIGCTGKLPRWKIKLDGEPRFKPKGSYSGETIKILQLTDIHYDPLYADGSVSNCDSESICCQEQSTARIAEDEEKAGYWADSSNCDISIRFFKATLEYISDNHDDVSYVYFTGDIVTHRIWDTTVFNNTQNIKLIHGLMKEYFPKIPLFSILGNHETHPLNACTPEEMDIANFESDWLFELCADIFPSFIPDFNGDVNTILKGGYYSHLAAPGFRIIALNSNPGFSFNWWLLYDSRDPYGQLQWLKRQLDKAEAEDEAVHILSHVPCNDQLSSVIWCKQFKRIVSRYSANIMAIFNGHTHVDELMIYHSQMNPQEPVVVGWNGGSLTPYDLNNPNYRIYEVDSQTYEVIDYEEYYVDLKTANEYKEKLDWAVLYTFKEEYGMHNLTPHGIRDLIGRMNRDPNLFNKYLRNRMKGAEMEEPCKRKCRERMICSFLRGDFHDERQCKQVIKGSN